MIFATVGMNEYLFDRLIQKMDEVAGELDEEVLIQTGSSDYECKNARYFKFADDGEMSGHYDRCDVLVCQAGVGTIINGLKRNKPIVVVPRRMELNEVDTNHQFMIADELVKMGRGICVEDIKDLKDAILKAKGMEFPPYQQSQELVNFLSDTLSEVEERLKKRKKR